MEKLTSKQLIYILPNLFTASSIFVGVVSMIASIHGEFEKAAWYILLALIFDGLDGRVARMTNTTSKFGVEFDSLADMVSFGMAPALLTYLYVGESFGKVGIVVSALFVIFGAIRLARFNVMTATIEPTVFIGVPIPTAAVFVSVIVLLFQEYPFLESFKVVILFLTVFLGLLMVSNIRYPSFKKIQMAPQHRMRILVGILSLAFIAYLYPIESVALFFVIYIFYGPIRALFTLSKLLKRR
jgi:CDP-diacylglycerol--serine O-phosphatidyltransferase